MKKGIIILFIAFSITLYAEYPDGNEILKKIDTNLYSDSQFSISQMIVHGRRVTKTMKVKTWTQGDSKSFSEYLYPPKDAGKKMLKLDDNLWIYAPDADRIIQISGNMLRQSVMGSDLSYEDFMEENELSEIYDAEVKDEEQIIERDCWVILLTATTDDVSYQIRKIWVDKERYLPLKEELYGKSGKLLKRVEIIEVFKVGNRWLPKKMLFKDMLKKGKGTEFIIDSIKFDVEIPRAIFSKASLRK